jgi:hypothetical protein
MKARRIAAALVLAAAALGGAAARVPLAPVLLLDFG